MPVRSQINKIGKFERKNGKVNKKRERGESSHIHLRWLLLLHHVLVVAVELNLVEVFLGFFLRGHALQKHPFVILTSEANQRVSKFENK